MVSVSNRLNLNRYKGHPCTMHQTPGWVRSALVIAGLAATGALLLKFGISASPAVSPGSPTPTPTPLLAPSVGPIPHEFGKNVCLLNSTDAAQICVAKIKNSTTTNLRNQTLEQRVERVAANAVLWVEIIGGVAALSGVGTGAMWLLERATRLKEPHVIPLGALSFIGLFVVLFVPVCSHVPIVPLGPFIRRASAWI
ncbi:MAG TPA: hypothetical protein VLE95_01440 [Chlamydiales bacterium]|nr:hypothetical protein [Chlamydiales bacterium]